MAREAAEPRGPWATGGRDGGASGAETTKRESAAREAQRQKEIETMQRAGFGPTNPNRRVYVSVLSIPAGVAEPWPFTTSARKGWNPPRHSATGVPGRGGPTARDGRRRAKGLSPTRSLSRCRCDTASASHPGPAGVISAPSCRVYAAIFSPSCPPLQLRPQAHKTWSKTWPTALRMSRTRTSCSATGN